MKLFFGSALDDMITELKGQGASMLRVHVLPEADGQSLCMQTHVTTVCNNQLYEACVETREDLPGADKGDSSALIRERCEAVRAEIVKKLVGFELRRGIVQE